MGTSSRGTWTGSAGSAAVDDEGIEVEASQDVLRYCVEKGSIAVEGVSLTIAGLGESSFTVALIPHTRDVTTLGGWPKATT